MHNPELVVQKLEKQSVISQDQLQNLIDTFPYNQNEGFVPFAAASDDFSLFGFMRSEIAMSERVNEGMLSAFQEMVLQEGAKLPAGAIKHISPFGILTNIIG
ncbi:hypothetical protein PUW25_25945 (plasmid) [Paenibacillus urinalis]|uniref:Uncharacterized protein n=1 Tax=Paenibacillus urinalis TaxID=521520 RepID=A0ABY7XGX4_9BACL|nr:hypothetical protein [Paenibacillus urinalis]WDI05015.1 hypothetical protein PUW25_25945 [Paenibacillus urinalis]